MPSAPPGVLTLAGVAVDQLVTMVTGTVVTPQSVVTRVLTAGVLLITLVDV